ncbi:hypothetical protein [Vannielia litorea]|uniref:Uncharacterized protein n=1 Tax=Vannielia litorea TaxID=1217970 RepID=A0A1N6FI53_9RHOB|nr:hypothetical protein [Vannielia litorea]SIN94886.1 hypothetical protein SAMN05444002_1686 [Vannielia litorea]
MPIDQDSDDHRNGPDPRDGPTVVLLPLPRLSMLPPDAWFEDAEGEEAMRRAEEDRLNSLRRRQSLG